MSMPSGINIMVIKALTVLSLGSAFSALCWLIPPAATAAKITLDFEGLKNLEFVNSYYNNGSGSLGSTSGPNYGIRFSSRALVLKDFDKGGTGDFGGNPSGSNALFLPQFTGEALATTSFAMNVESGFTSLFSFYYSAPFIGSTYQNNNIQANISLYDGLSGQGNRLQSIDLTQTPIKGQPDPNGVYSPFILRELFFAGVARSVVFSGTSGFVAYDDLSLNLVDRQPPASIPTPALLPGILGLGLSTWRRSRKVNNLIEK